MKRNVLKLYGEGKNKTILGEHILEITDTEIIDKTEPSEQRTRISAVELIGSNAEYVFIYIGALSAHIIPRNNILEGDADLFLEEVKKRYEQSRPAS